ncbi:phage tail protein [Tissierella sp.]|uniref:phage tail protein n=1 Tax=Tissierella sp. TaxID=41274 RepID=UPI0028B1B276|nr:phage tail protein [Tissierella sp.]
MAEQFYTILTQLGKAKIANASMLGNKVNFTDFALGDGGGKYYNPTENQIELKNEVWRGKIGQIVVDEKNSNWIIMETIIPADQGGFMIREAGIFDDEGSLLAVGKYPETYKPLITDGGAKDLYIRMILEVANTSIVNLKVDPTVILATKKDIDEVKKEVAENTNRITNLIDDLDKHKTKNITSHNVARGIYTFAGNGKEVTIPHGLKVKPISAYAFPAINPEGYLGEIWIRIDETNLYVGNSGSFTGAMSWIAIG